MARLLFLAYYYPPFGGAGVQRSLKFTKYLPDYGWEPLILTVKSKYSRLRDITLMNEIPANVSIDRSQAFLPPGFLPWRLRRFIARWLLLVDEQLGWYPFAIHQSKKIIYRKNIKAIYSTSPPFTSHLIGYHLSKETKLPWVADFRDPWIGNFVSQFPTWIHEKLAMELERMVVQQANKVVVVSEPMREALLARYGGTQTDRVCTIPNGFDQDDFDGVLPFDYGSARMTIVYTGSFYTQVHTPRPFLEPLKSILDNHLIPRNDIQVFLVGNIGKMAHNQITEFSLNDIVKTTGYLPHRQSLAHLLGADVLLFIVGQAPGSEAVITGKIFEYLAVRKPILAITPPGAAADLIHQAKAGIVVNPQDTAAIINQITTLYQQWKNGELSIDPDSDVISRYDRRMLTGQLANLLGGLM